LLVTGICFLISELAPEFAVGLFTNDEEMVNMASKALRVMNCAIWLVGFGIVSSNFFQCLGMVKKSIFLSLTRQLLFLLPVVFVMPIWFQETGVWMSFPISDFLNMLVSAIMIFSTFKKFNRLEDGQESVSLGSVVN